MANAVASAAAAVWGHQSLAAPRLAILISLSSDAGAE